MSDSAATIRATYAEGYAAGLKAGRIEARAETIGIYEGRIKHAVAALTQPLPKPQEPQR